jgi:hypothetical protein
MGEAKRRSLTRLKKPSMETEAEMVDTTSVPGMTIIRHPQEIIDFREELSKPENHDLWEAGMKGKNFEECIANVCTGLKIRVDGEYDPLALLNMLTMAMKNRGQIGLSTPYMLAAELKPITKDMMQQDLLTLFDFGESYGTINNPLQEGRGPYTICDSCVHSFDCITNRTCEKGKPAIQLENTMKVIEVGVMGKGRMH